MKRFIVPFIILLVLILVVISTDIDQHIINTLEGAWCVVRSWFI